MNRQTDSSVRHVPEFDVSMWQLMSSYRRLSDEEQAVLGCRVRDLGDQEARELLILHNLRLVYFAVKPFFRRCDECLTESDLLMIGLGKFISVIERWDPSIGGLGTFAILWIEQAVRRALEENQAIRSPAYQVRNVTRYWRTFASLEERYQRNVGRAEVIAFLGISEQEADMLESILAGCVSLDDPLGEAEGRERDSLLDLVPDQESDTEALGTVKILQTEVQAALSQAFGQMKTKWVTVVIRRLGLDGAAPWTLVEIAHEMKLTKQRVQRIYQLAIKELRRHPAICQACGYSVTCQEV